MTPDLHASPDREPAPAPARTVSRSSARPALRPAGPAPPGVAGVGTAAAAHDLAALPLRPPGSTATGAGGGTLPVPGPRMGPLRGRERRSYRLSVLVPRADPVTAGGHARDHPGAHAGAGALDRAADGDSATARAGERVREEAFGGLTVEEADSISPTLTYAPAIRNEGSPGADEFGVTSTSIAITGITVAPDAATHSFRVAGDVRSTITWSVQALGRTDIPGETAPAITHANYPTVASDLTPDLTSDGGRPPRTRFWARDLTERHERFHADERATTYGRPAFDFAVAWLGGETAADAAAATILTRRVPGKMHESYAASYSPGKETRAYGDGAPSYTARATAVSAKGGRNEYPGAPPPPSAPAPGP